MPEQTECGCDCHASHSYNMPCSLVSPCCDHAGGDLTQPVEPEPVECGTCQGSGCLPPTRTQLDGWAEGFEHADPPPCSDCGGQGDVAPAGKEQPCADARTLLAEVERLRERERALIRAKDADIDDVRDELEWLKGVVQAATDLVRSAQGSHFFHGWDPGIVSVVDLLAALGIEPNGPPPPPTEAERLAVRDMLAEVRSDHAALAAAADAPQPVTEQR